MIFISNCFLYCDTSAMLYKLSYEVLLEAGQVSNYWVFHFLKLQIAKWHTSYPAWWGSAWDQHSWNRKHWYGYNLSWERMFLWLPPMFSRSHRHILSLLWKLNEGNIFLVLWLFLGVAWLTSTKEFSLIIFTGYPDYPLRHFSGLIVYVYWPEASRPTLKLNPDW